MKHIRLTVRAPSQKKIQDAIHFNLVPGNDHMHAMVSSSFIYNL
ncbi:hypothetical protein BAE44_0014392 [Dichanthelium oligosanthes]|uniref:Uncharacterized protein n=1 Tax=Dichanthelium oligosanthes TaxID=888268 RepID=A0A1E5VHH6_9POAL|nr:hypothetical protein BAE44_0014392 [Dichanthelium oligosanthes]